MAALSVGLAVFPAAKPQALRKRAAEENCEVVVVSARVESELNEMPEEEAKEWLDMLGVTDGGLAALVRATYKTLGLQTYFTTGGCWALEVVIGGGWGVSLADFPC